MLRNLKLPSDKLLLSVDLTGTFVFAVEGAMKAIDGHLDFFGIMVLSFVTASGGGIIRDLLIGATPPASIRDRRYAIAAFTGGMVAFFLHYFVRMAPAPLLIGLDAAGLSLFAVSGTAKAVEYGIDPFMSVLMGTITGVGGGTIRDMFLAQVPAVLRVDIYAVAAFTGCGVMLLLMQRGTPRTRAMVVGGTICFILRIVSVWQHWNLPRVSGT